MSRLGDRWKALPGGRALRWAAYALAGLLAAGALLFVGADWALRSDWFAGWLRAKVLAETERVLGEGVTIASIELDSAALRVDLHDFRSPPEPRLDGQPLLEAPLIRLGLGWESVWRGPLFLRSIVVESPQIRLATDEQGLTLPRIESALARSLAVGARRVDLRHARVSWNGKIFDASVEAEDVDALTRSAVDGCHEATLAAGRVAWELRGRSGAVDSADARASLCGERLTVSEARLKLGEAALSASGEATLADPPSATLDYEISGPLETAAAWLPPDWTLSGRLEADGRLAWNGDGNELTYEGRARASELGARAGAVKLSEATLSTGYRGSMDRIELSDLALEAFGGAFHGSAQLTDPFEPGRRFEIAGDAEGFRLRSLLAAAGSTKAIPWGSAVRAHIEATGSSPEDLQASADITLDGLAAGSLRPLDGSLRAHLDGATQQINIEALDVRTAVTRVQATGRMDEAGETATDLLFDASAPDDLLSILDLFGLDLETAPFRALGPVRFEGGLLINLGRKPLAVALNGALESGELELLGYPWQGLEARFKLDSAGFEIDDAILRDERGQAKLALQGTFPPEKGWGWSELPLAGRLDATALDVAKALETAKVSAPLTGLWSGSATLDGPLEAARVSVDVAVTDGSLADQPFQRLAVRGALRDGVAAIEELELQTPAGSLRGQGRYELAGRRFELDLGGHDWRIEQLERLRSRENPPTGQATFDVRASGVLAADHNGVERLETSGSWRLADLVWQGRELGALEGGLSSRGDAVRLDWTGTPLGGSFSGDAVVEIPSGAFHGDATISDLDAGVLAELSDLPLDDLRGAVAGKLSLTGDLRNLPDSFRAEGAFEQVSFNVGSLVGSDLRYQLYNPFPMRWVFEGRRLQLEHMRLQGDGTDIEVDGDIAFDGTRALDLQIEGEFNLAALGSLDGDLQAAGRSTVKVSVTGDRSSPDVSGNLRIRDGSLRSEGFANGLTGVEGDVEFEGRQVRIRELSGLTGGGRVVLTGLSQFDRDNAEYRLRADVERVRIRYPSSVSSVIDGRLALSGNREQSLLSGQVTVLRAATNPEVSLGALIGSLREPTTTPSTSGLLRNMQLNIQVVSAADLMVETSLVRDIEAEIDLRVVGGLNSPSLLGRMNVSRGRINFNGSGYRINRGEIDFVNPFRIEPVLDFELETRIRDIDIGLILSGPARRLNVSYRSDPPVSFADLVNLVAVGRSPTTDPVTASRQRIQQQSLFQTGANTVFNQAVERPVSPGLQRFFGVSRLKVDPQAGGAEANPAARISTEQQITDQVTLIYTYDLSSAQQQTFRLEYAPYRRWTFVLTRDQNGLVGSDILFKTRLP
ncbi:MAG: hypothetical protein GC160_20180 [Acidobacteria bacterium]|nr:hypothetical protein [Acidobacteriota bacterium]